MPWEILKLLIIYDTIVEHMEKYMMEAYEQAKIAEAQGEIPIGAVIVKDGKIIGKGHNTVENSQNPLGHAEIHAIEEASRALGSRRLIGCEMYVTLEPCAMCSGAIVLSRLEKLYIGTMDPKAGGCGSLFNIVQEDQLNHYVEVEVGVMEEACSQIVKNFFKELRKRGKNK